MNELNSFAKDKSLYHRVDEPDGFVVELLVKEEYDILEKTHGKEARAADSLVQLLRVNSSGEQGSLHHSLRGAGSKSRVCLRHNSFGRGPGHNLFGRELPGEGGPEPETPWGDTARSSAHQGSRAASRTPLAAASTTPGSPCPEGA